jgi:hypothetical protein
MLNTYCATCGAVNHLGEGFCVGCGANLALQPGAVSAPPRDSRPADSHEWQPFQNPLRSLAGIGPFSVGKVISSSLSIFFKNIWVITKIVFVVVAPFEIFKVLSLAQGRQDWQTTLLMFLLGAICNVLIAPALIYALMKILETGAAPGVNESFRWGLTKIWRLAVCAGISWVLQVLGYMLCIIPGIIVSLTLALVYPVAILEKEPAEEVLRRSSTLTRGYRLEILIAGLGLGLVVGAIGLPFGFLMVNANWPPMDVVGGVIIDILEQSFTVLSLVMYLSLIRTPRQGRLLLPLSN